ncbi:anthranilate synthase component [Lactifluus volemus]|nr:anthranilate synthase component [Lactifluus volemus]
MDPQLLPALPSLDDLESLIFREKRGNCVPVYIQLSSDLITPVIAYLRIAHNSKYSFLLESVVGGESVARYSFIGADPFKLVKVGPREAIQGDPLHALERELSVYKYIKIPQVPTLPAVPLAMSRTTRFSTLSPRRRARRRVHARGHAPHIRSSFQTIKVVSHVFCPENSSPSNLAFIYQTAVSKIRRLARAMLSPVTPEVPQEPITLGHTSTSNVGKEGYEQFVTTLKEHIVQGDIIQAVPSQRLSRQTQLHPFNAYRQLRQVNPSPYMFYLDCGECRLSVESNKVYNHAIAGTVKRGETAEEDERLGQELLSSEKDRAEHIMLVDLARNDTVKVDHLMKLEKFSHVIHLTSQVSGLLRDGLTRFDAFRSIFPAGTVSGAPKIKAIELVYGLEEDHRGVYAGAVGRFDFANDEMDTCIAIRTTVFKDGVAYLQAGGGITINKLKGNMKALEEGERYWYDMQHASNPSA